MNGDAGDEEPCAPIELSVDLCLPNLFLETKKSQISVQMHLTI